ncbi:MAG TPA: RagB/SusD family nutrient uptake outer membrane protein, partial [Parapedobacter sp.]|nr:RagB/SusD family nutrient uptake outer membrane protein [Parapedobacter sp.]
NLYFGQGRTAADAVYQQIIADLEAAIGNLPVRQAQQGKATRHAANALLGKVYLTRNEPAQAKQYFLEVVNSEQYQLEAIDRVFAIANENNDEIIFDVQFASGVNGNQEGSSMQQQFSPSGTLANAKGHNLPTRSLYNLYAADDLRKEYYVGITANNIPFSKKLVQPTTAPADGGSNFVVIRYADILLLLAEIENETGNGAAAVAYVNAVRQRANASPIQAGLPADRLGEAIELERRLELICEGHRWFDLLRYGTAVDVMNAWFDAEGINITVGAHHVLMPIPQGQLDTDPAITLNTGYN